MRRNPGFSLNPIVFLLLAALLPFLNGCSSSAKREIAEAEASGKTVIEFWHALSQDHQNVIDEFSAAFEAANPDVKVLPVYQGAYAQLKLNINNSLAAGAPPTLALMYEGWATEFNEEGHLAPVQDFIDKGDGSFQSVVDDIYSSFVEGNSRDGRLLTLPFNKSTFLVFYNVEKLAAKGFDKFPETLEAMVEMAGELTERDDSGDVTFFGLGLRSTLEPFTCLLYACDGQYMTEGEDGSLIAVNTPEAAKALGLIQRLINDDKIAYVDGGYMSAPFGAENLAFYWGSSAGIPFVNKSVGDKFTVGTACLPMTEGGSRGYLSQGTNIGIFKAGTPEQQDAAWRFLQFIMTPENTAHWAATSGYLPTRRAARDVAELADYIEANPPYQTCIEQLEHLKFEPTVGYWEQIRADLIQELDSAFRGRKKVEDALEAAEGHAQSVIKRNAAK